MEYWYKDAIVYTVDVKTFQDSNGDGMCDFPGLIRRLDYIADLGFNCVWVLPFYPSPLRDNGYDMTDYTSVDSRLGTLDDFDTFLQEAHALDIRVIVDVVANHTSNQHPWFLDIQRHGRESRYFEYYVWADEPPPNTGDETIFPGVEDSTWEHNVAVDAYYWHYFYHFQPGLDHHNPKVRQEFQRIMAIWIERGVDGIRIDAAPLLISQKGTPEARKKVDHKILEEMRAFVEAKNDQVVLVGEADVELDKLVDSVDHDSELHMLFNFLLNAHLILAFARRDAQDLERLFEQSIDMPESAQWLNFLRNLDELDLERLSKDEQQDIYDAFAPEDNMRAYGRGVRRRLAPMLGGDQRFIQLAFDLLFSIPGAPLIVYGDEIGMGDDLSQDERDAIRTPMQWSNEPNAGFSSAPVEHLTRPVIDTGPFRYQEVNAADQQQDPNSLLNWFKRLIEQRKHMPEIAHGDMQLIATEDTRVFAHRCDLDGQSVVMLHNLGEEPAHVKLDGEDYANLVDIRCDQDYPPMKDGEVELDGYGYRWLTFADESGG